MYFIIFKSSFSLSSSFDLFFFYLFILLAYKYLALTKGLRSYTVFTHPIWRENRLSDLCVHNFDLCINLDLCMHNS